MTDFEDLLFLLGKCREINPERLHELVYLTKEKMRGVIFSDFEFVPEAQSVRSNDISRLIFAYYTIRLIEFLAEHDKWNYIRMTDKGYGQAVRIEEEDRRFKKLGPAIEAIVKNYSRMGENLGRKLYVHCSYRIILERNEKYAPAFLQSHNLDASKMSSIESLVDSMKDEK